MDTFSAYVDDYYRQFIEVLSNFDRTPLLDILDLLTRLSANGGTLWTAGNGGSAAIANHSVCDLTKGTFRPGGGVRCVSLSANAPLLTAIGNDIRYEEVFSKQLEYYVNSHDAVLLVSSSGNSSNVIHACEYAKLKGVPTIAFVGFDGGKLKNIADYCVWIPSRNYGIVEDTHQSLIHVLSQFMANAPGISAKGTVV